MDGVWIAPVTAQVTRTGLRRFFFTAGADTATGDLQTIANGEADGAIGGG
jgi:hypothetical protein